VQTHLSQAEYKLFASMDVRDQQHACWVTKALLNHVPDASEALIAAALLHDVGKGDVPFWPLERILIHLVDKVYTHRPPVQPKYSSVKHWNWHQSWQSAWQRKCHHELYGAQTIRQTGGRPQVAAIIEATRQTDLQSPCDIDASDTDMAAYLLKCIDQCF
jgi:hypothetical protein